MNTKLTSLIAVIAVTFPGIGTALSAGGRDYKPVINPAEFTHKITNPYFPLTPGTVRKYVEKAGAEVSEITSTVTGDTKTLMGVKCVVVHEVVFVGGKQSEDKHEWYAQHRDGSVWFFGELTKEFKSGGRMSTEGSWEAGVGGALPGVVMPGELKVGVRFHEELAADVAEDMGEIQGLHESATTAAGKFADCVRLREWSMLESGSAKQWFARGVGFVRSESSGGEECVLVSTNRK